MNKFALLATAAVALASMPANAQNLVVNGSFEAPAIATFYQNFASGSTAITGWTVDAFSLGTDNVDIVNGLYTPGGPALAADGDQYLDLVGFGTRGSIYQALTTVVGQTYTLSFSYSHNVFGGSASEQADFAAYASLGNNQLLDLVIHSSGNSSNLDWKTYTGTFTAVSTTTNIGFATYAGSSNSGALIDNVSVVANVPEPATWAMMIGGLGLVGASMRRRKTVAAFA